MSASPSPAFRIGVLLSGTLIAEHVLRERRPFSIGQSTRTTVCLPIDALPRTWELMTLVEGGVALRLAEGMDARVSVGGEVWTREELARRGTVARGVLTVVLPMAARGRVEVGEVRVLFQGVQLAKVAPPVLPRALRGTLADRIDGRVAAFAAASITLHVGLMIAAAVNDPPRDVSIAKQAAEQYPPDTIAIIDADDPILSMPDESEPAPADADPAPAVAEPARPAPAVAKPVRPAPSRPSIDPGSLGDPAADAQRAVDGLFAPSDETGTGRPDLTARRPGSDLGKQLAEIAAQDRTASIGDGADTRLPDDRAAARPGTIQDPVVGDPPGTIAQQGPKKPEQIPSTITIKRPPTPPGEPDTDAIVQKINRVYMGGLQRCYKKSLVGNAVLAGKVMLTFTVTEKGSLGAASASGVDDALEACIEGLMSKWRFDPPVDEDGEATEVDLRLPLLLTPH